MSMTAERQDLKEDNIFMYKRAQSGHAFIIRGDVFWLNLISSIPATEVIIT